MTKYFDLLLDLLEIQEPDRSSFAGIGEIISHHTNKELIIQHRMRFIFEAWWDLLHERIDLETFLATGDVISKVSILKIKNEELKIKENSMIVMDEIGFMNLSKAEQENLQNEAEKKDAILLLC